jgi:hypothetical protein
MRFLRGDQRCVLRTNVAYKRSMMLAVIFEMWRIRRHSHCLRHPDLLKGKDHSGPPESSTTVDCAPLSKPKSDVASIEIVTATKECDRNGQDAFYETAEEAFHIPVETRFGPIELERLESAAAAGISNHMVVHLTAARQQSARR